MYETAPAYGNVMSVGAVMKRDSADHVGSSKATLIDTLLPVESVTAMVAFPDVILEIVRAVPFTCTLATLVLLLVAEYGPLPPAIVYPALVPGVIETCAGAVVNKAWLLVVATAIKTLPPAASVMATSAAPGAMPTTVNELPLTLTVATLVLLLAAVYGPLPPPIV
jgi:hypothetical protein